MFTLEITKINIWNNMFFSWVIRFCFPHSRNFALQAKDWSQNSKTGSACGPSGHVPLWSMQLHLKKKHSIYLSLLILSCISSQPIIFKVGKCDTINTKISTHPGCQFSLSSIHQVLHHHCFQRYFHQWYCNQKWIFGGSFSYRYLQSPSCNFPSILHSISLSLSIGYQK